MVVLPRRGFAGIRRAMNRTLIKLIGICAAALLLSGCGGSKVRVTSGTQTVQTKPRSEPIFYNGKTYRLDYAYSEASSQFEMRVGGMGPKQEKDAVAVATSSLRYFACTDGQDGRLRGEPAYAGGVWKLQAQCAAS
jgi:hypothetical protein